MTLGQLLQEAASRIEVLHATKIMDIADEPYPADVVDGLQAMSTALAGLEHARQRRAKASPMAEQWAREEAYEKEHKRAAQPARGERLGVPIGAVGTVIREGDAMGCDVQGIYYPMGHTCQECSTPGASFERALEHLSLVQQSPTGVSTGIHVTLVALYEALSKYFAPNGELVEGISTELQDEQRLYDVIIEKLTVPDNTYDSQAVTGYAKRVLEARRAFFGKPAQDKDEHAVIEGLQAVAGMKYEPYLGAPLNAHCTAPHWRDLEILRRREDKKWKYNPYTGQPRAENDIAQDPKGLLIKP